MVLDAHTTYPHTHAYVLMLHRDSSPREGRIMGRLEHVDSGHQFLFNSAEELLACLVGGAAYADAMAQEDVR